VRQLGAGDVVVGIDVEPDADVVQAERRQRFQRRRLSFELVVANRGRLNRNVRNSSEAETSGAIG
jgi:hypothetical protein